jgi:hypothetical protein
MKRAAVLFGAADSLYDSHGFNPQLGDAPGYERSKTLVKEQLDSEAYTAARNQGWNMSRSEAVSYALKAYREY